MHIKIFTFRNPSDLCAELQSLLLNRFGISCMQITQGETGYRLFVHCQAGKRRRTRCSQEVKAHFEPFDVDRLKPCFRDEAQQADDGTLKCMVRTYAVPMPDGRSYLMIVVESTPVPKLVHSVLMD